MNILNKRKNVLLSGKDGYRKIARFFTFILLKQLFLKRTVRYHIQISFHERKKIKNN